MLSDQDFYRENLIREQNDEEKRLEAFRIFKSKDPDQDPVFVMTGEESCLNLTKTFPEKYEIIKSIYDSEFIKVKLCKNKHTEALVMFKLRML